MANNESQNPAQLDPDLEQEIREGRKFSLAEAIGRLGGPGMMKGTSPATLKQQSVAKLATYLERHVHGPAGALSAVLFRQVKDCDLLLNNVDAPLVVLAAFLERILASEQLLHELVREADVEWGRIYGERPYLQKEGTRPHEDDPYTVESVRSILTQVVERLAAGDALVKEDA